MAHPKSLRDKLRALYAGGEQSLESAAALCDVSMGTARRWRDEARKNGDDWDKLRAAYTLAGGSVEEIARTMLSSFLVQYQATMTMLQDSNTEDLPPSKRAQLLASLADAFTKTVSANRKMLPETSQLATALELLQLLMSFVQEKYPKHLAAFVDVLEPFGAEVEKRFG